MKQQSRDWNELEPASPSPVRVSRAELEANRAKLAEKMAKATGAIVAPAGKLVLEDVGTLPTKPREVYEPMNEPTVHTNGVGTETAVTATATSHNTRKPPSDERLREMHAEYMAGSTIREVATRHHVSNATLSKHFARLGLETRPVGFRNSGKSVTPAAFAKQAAADRLAKANDQLITRWHKLYLDGMTAKELGLREGVSPVALLNRFREMGLHVFNTDDHTIKVVDLRQPYTAPTVTAVPLNSNGPHAEAAREMVAKHVGAQTDADSFPYVTPSQAAAIASVSYETVRRWCHAGKLPFTKAGAGDMAILRADLDEFLRGIGAQTPAQTAVEPIVGYGILHDMIGLLPVNGRWTDEDCKLWINAFSSLLHLYVRKEVRP